MKSLCLWDSPEAAVLMDPPGGCSEGKRVENSEYPRIEGESDHIFQHPLAFLKLGRRVRERMAKRRVSFADDKQCTGCRTLRNVLLALTLLCCVSCSMWLLWGSGNCGILAKLEVRDLQYPRKQILFDRFNISKYHLRSLALLMSSLEQVNPTLLLQLC